jgi:hypothetical protein
MSNYHPITQREDDYGSRTWVPVDLLEKAMKSMNIAENDKQVLRQQFKDSDSRAQRTAELMVRPNDWKYIFVSKPTKDKRERLRIEGPIEISYIAERLSASFRVIIEKEQSEGEEAIGKVVSANEALGGMLRLAKSLVNEIEEEKDKAKKAIENTAKEPEEQGVEPSKTQKTDKSPKDLEKKPTENEDKATQMNKAIQTENLKDLEKKLAENKEKVIQINETIEVLEVTRGAAKKVLEIEKSTSTMMRNIVGLQECNKNLKKLGMETSNIQKMKDDLVKMHPDVKEVHEASAITKSTENFSHMQAMLKNLWDDCDKLQKASEKLDDSATKEIQNHLKAAWRIVGFIALIVKIIETLIAWFKPE